MNSIPISGVLLDGKPLGRTPVLGVSVAAGPHTVMFVTSDGQRKSVPITIKAGETKTAATKFPSPSTDQPPPPPVER
jgi:hypothetical protein